jgi:hypothetical protein
VRRTVSEKNRINPSRGIDAALTALAVAPPAFWLSELSTPMLKLRAPTHSELYTAYRYRWPLAAAGIVAGATLFWRALRGDGSSGLAKGSMGALGALAALVPLIYDPLLFSPRHGEVRIRRAEEAGSAFEGDDTEVLGVRLNGEARAYPARKAARPHFIADTLGGEPIVVSYCGLTNSAIAYRSGDDLAPELPVVSAPSNNILYWDARTKSLVQQLLLELAYGPSEGRPLRTLPVTYTTWEAWQRLVPETTLADPPYESLRDRFGTWLMRYVHMKTRIEEKPFLAVAGGANQTLHPKARVFAICEAGEARAYTRGFLKDRRAVDDEARGRPFVIFHEPESDIAAAYRSELDGRRLGFRLRAEGGFEDEETGTRWDVLGRATEGPQAGRTLDPVPFSFDKVFWFGWKHYQPDTALLRFPGERAEPQTSQIGPTTLQVE